MLTPVLFAMPHIGIAPTNLEELSQSPQISIGTLITTLLKHNRRSFGDLLGRGTDDRTTLELPLSSPNMIATPVGDDTRSLEPKHPSTETYILGCRVRTLGRSEVLRFFTRVPTTEEPPGRRIRVAT